MAYITVPIRSKINRKAHALALLYEAKVKQEITLLAEAALSEEKSLDEVSALIDNAEKMLPIQKNDC